MPNDDDMFPEVEFPPPDPIALAAQNAARRFERQVSAVPPAGLRLQDTLMRHCAAASLAGGIIAASGVPHDTEAALAVFRDVLARLYPARE